uniref:Protease n=1 Tax=viral metagenome TaxID=1070528 RepID=A0A2V0RLL0_9ZZZZ
MTSRVLHEISEEHVAEIISAGTTTLFVNSGGGDINSALVLLHYCERNQVKVIIAGQCSSAACYLLALSRHNVEIKTHAYGVQHAPSTLRDPQNNWHGFDDCGFKAAHRQWNQDKKVYEELLDREISDLDAFTLFDYHLATLVDEGNLRKVYFGDDVC